MSLKVADELQQQQLKRNLSALLEDDAFPPPPTDSTIVTQSRNDNEMRQVHSTPNLQKMMNGESRQSMSHPNSQSISNITPSAQLPSHSPCAPPKALSYMTSIRHRLSNASSIFKYREESRAARISILVVIMFLVSYFPYGLLVLMQGRLTFITNSSLLGVLFLLVANASSPFIFAYRNKRVRRGVCRLFGMDAKTNERLQKRCITLRSSANPNNCCGSAKRQSKIVTVHRNPSKVSSYSTTSTVSGLHGSITCCTHPRTNSVLVAITDEDLETNEHFAPMINGAKSDKIDATKEKISFIQRVSRKLSKQPSGVAIKATSKNVQPVEV